MSSNKVYYYGCNGDTGHFWWEPGQRYRINRPTNVPQCIQVSIDGGFVTGSKEGVAELTHVNDWTVLGFPDQSVDYRGGSHSTFVIQAERLSFNDALLLARNAWPDIFARFDFEIVSKPSNTTDKGDEA